MESIIIAIITTISGVITILIKSNSDNKKFTIKENLINERIAEHDNALQKLEGIAERRDNKEKFESNLKNILSRKASYKINNNPSIKESKFLRKAVKDLAKELAEFGIYFNKTDSRKLLDVSKNDLELSLKDDIDSIIYEFFDIISINYKTEKAYKAGNKLHSVTLPGYIILMDEICKEPGCLKLTQLFLIRLIENGYKENDDDIIKDFINYFDKFIEKLGERIKEFNGLLDYDIEIKDEI